MEKIYIIIQIIMTLPNRLFYLFIFSCFFIALWLLISDICWIIYLNGSKEESEEESDLPENNLVEFVWEDEEWNGIYRIK